MMSSACAPRDFKKKILSLPSAIKLCRSLQKKGKKIIFTNGCFDLIHEGHVQYLLDARKKGDVLIVAVDDDASVKALKGSDRPVNTLRSRQKVLAALESVDLVLSFTKSNPVPLIKKIKPDILVKGGDWLPEKILGYKEVKSWGGKIFSIRFVQGRSTTNIIKKIRSL